MDYLKISTIIQSYAMMHGYRTCDLNSNVILKLYKGRMPILINMKYYIIPCSIIAANSFKPIKIKRHKYKMFTCIVFRQWCLRCVLHRGKSDN